MRSLMEKSLNLDYVNWAKAVFIKFTNLISMIANQNFYGTCFTIFYPTASATAYGQRPKFFWAEHSATAEGENCAYGPTLLLYNINQSEKWGKKYTNPGL